MAKYDSTVIPMVESLAQLTHFLESYPAHVELHVPPMHYPQKHLLAVGFKMRLSTKEQFTDKPLFVIKGELLEKPGYVRTVTRGNRRVELSENDILARRWQAHIEHLITFVLESPTGIRADVMYRHMGGYLQTASGQSLLDTMRAQLSHAMQTGKLPLSLSLWDDRFDQSRALGAGDTE